MNWFKFSTALAEAIQTEFQDLLHKLEEKGIQALPDYYELIQKPNGMWVVIDNRTGWQVVFDEPTARHAVMMALNRLAYILASQKLLAKYARSGLAGHV
ncbi:MAG: hypothetical protein HC888_01935 [Candidatus Competibacteraceae bacterium]|nr:hypothetical protein [Candidatus Competibacteraceae bacterium]